MYMYIYIIRACVCACVFVCVYTLVCASEVVCAGMGGAYACEFVHVCVHMFISRAYMCVSS